MEELSDLSHLRADDGNLTRPQSAETGHETLALLPADRGKDAWLYLAASFMMEMLIWGFAFTFGLFQEYYSSHDLFSSSGNIAVIGSCSLVSLSNYQY
jgi:hypothetical protein